ncbi:hypothetical protein ACLMAL_39230 [Nocardia sp. CWNU-33]|uniref:hypothetical protein n=1 Tax=Nocardia sp. CWNU-33 TaxID=3392117 RepID=UPI00398F6576
MPQGTSTNAGPSNLGMDFEERQALIEDGHDPDDLRLQLRMAAAVYWLRRRAIEAGI